MIDMFNKKNALKALTCLNDNLTILDITPLPLLDKLLTC